MWADYLELVLVESMAVLMVEMKENLMDELMVVSMVG